MLLYIFYTIYTTVNNDINVNILYDQPFLKYFPTNNYLVYTHSRSEIFD